MLGCCVLQGTDTVLRANKCAHHHAHMYERMHLPHTLTRSCLWSVYVVPLMHTLLFNSKFSNDCLCGNVLTDMLPDGIEGAV